MQKLLPVNYIKTMDIKIVKIKISETKDKEIEEIIKVYNNSFGVHIASLRRGMDSWRWRYKLRPDAEEDVVIVAKMGEKIVGTVIVTFRPVKIENKIYKFGMIDDVATLPSFAGQGIARKMLNLALDYIREKNCSAGALYADPNYIAIKLYRKLGFYDICGIKNFIYPFFNFNLFLKIPFLLPLLPLIFCWQGLVKHLLFFKSAKEKVIIEEIKEHQMKNCILSINKFHSNFVGFSDISEDYFFWKHTKIPSEHRTVFLVAREEDNIVGGISLIAQTVRFKNRDLTHFFINEFFYEGKKVGYSLLGGALEYLRGGEISTVGFQCTEKNKEMINIFRGLFSLPVGQGSFMIKDMKDDFFLSKYSSSKWYLMNESAIGIP